MENMSRAAERVLMLLAASGFTASDLKDAVKFLRSSHDEEIMLMISSRRRDIANLNTERIAKRYHDLNELDNRGVAHHFSNKRSLSEENKVDQVIDLLKKEAHLTNDQIALDLQRLLSEVSGGSSLPTFRPRYGLRAWLQQLSREVPMTVLLHLAARVRNEHAHGRLADWPLRERSKSSSKPGDV